MKKKPLPVLRPCAQSKQKSDDIEAVCNSIIKYIFTRHFELADQRGDVTLNDSGTILFASFYGTLKAIAKEAAKRGIPNSRINTLLNHVVATLSKTQLENQFTDFEARSLLN